MMLQKLMDAASRIKEKAEKVKLPPKEKDKK
jgi:hypothetical protein